MYYILALKCLFSAVGSLPFYLCWLPLIFQCLSFMVSISSASPDSHFWLIAIVLFSSSSTTSLPFISSPVHRHSSRPARSFWDSSSSEPLPSSSVDSGALLRFPSDSHSTFNVPISLPLISPFLLPAEEECNVVLWHRRWFMIDWQGTRRRINQGPAVELCHNANGVLIECWMSLNNGSGFSLQSMHITTKGWRCGFHNVGCIP